MDCSPRPGGKVQHGRGSRSQLHRLGCANGVAGNLSHLVIHTDGGARGNPGPAALGVVIEVERDGQREVVAELAERIGVASNNVAEYKAIIRGLEEGIRLGADSISFLLDSQLVVEQLNGSYRVKSDDLRPLWQRVNELRSRLPLVTFQHVRREENNEADRLVNQALDRG